MATVTTKTSKKRQFGGFSPFGNVTTLHYQVLTDATGTVTNSDATAALAAGDVVDLGLLPEGLRLDDASLFVLTGMTATITGSLGFKYADGIDDPTTPQDATYFMSGTAIATAGRYRANTGKLITLPKPARLILTTAVAANAKASQIDVIITGELKGNR